MRYPPLSFYVVNALSAATGIDVLYGGRLLSLAATVAIAFAVWACVRRLGASRLAATLGALWWLASMARWYARYVGMDDPHLVALAVMTWALAYALRDPNSKRVEGAIVVMVLAGSTNTISLLFRRRPCAGGRCKTTGAGFAWLCWASALWPSASRFAAWCLAKRFLMTCSCRGTTI